MSTFSPFITAVKDKILATSSYVTDSANVLYTNNVDLATLPATAFPRIEFYVDTATGNDYVSQRDIEWEFRFSFMGYLKRTDLQDGSESMWTEADFVDIWNFAEETMANVMNILDDTQNDPLLAPNFLFFRGTPVLGVFCELIPTISTFMGSVTAVFQKEDTNGQ
jgi:hypothetical protein